MNSIATKCQDNSTISSWQKSYEIRNGCSKTRADCEIVCTCAKRHCMYFENGISSMKWLELTTNLYIYVQYKSRTKILSQSEQRVWKKRFIRTYIQPTPSAKVNFKTKEFFLENKHTVDLY